MANQLFKISIMKPIKFSVDASLFGVNTQQISEKVIHGKAIYRPKGKAAEYSPWAKAGSYENSIALRAAEQYARSVIVNPDEHLDAVESTITDFMTGVEWSTNRFIKANKKQL